MTSADRTANPWRQGLTIVLLAAGAGSVAPSPGRATEATSTPVEGPPGTLNFITENDTYVPGGTDRHFTNGLRLCWAGPRAEFPKWTGPLPRLFDWLAPEDTKRQRWLGGAFGQNMYTPEDIGERELISDDRPYAGWLYAGLVLTERHGDRRFDEMEIDLGATGPVSLAKSTQINFHKLINSPRPNGWDNQIENELGLVFLYRAKWRDDLWRGPTLLRLVPEGLELDLVRGGSLSLGNILTYVQGDLTLRFGDNLSDDFGPPRITPALQGSTFFRREDDFGWNVFAGAALRAVARNIFLDGNTFVDSHNVNKNPVVADFQAGVTVRLGGLRVSYTHVWRTREFDTQKGADRWGAVAISFNY